MKDVLAEIVNFKKKELEALKQKAPITHFVNSRRLLKGVRPFKEAISTSGRINLIAEIKKKSPSKLNEFFKKYEYTVVAEIYERSGAKALSVLTDKKFFGGNVSHITEIRKKCSLPILRKDFIIDEYQVYESRYHGADAILLIARLLGKEELGSFIHLAKRIGMDCLVEVHDEVDLEKALSNNADIIGINNRDLDTLEININTTFSLFPKIPDNTVVVSESGIKTNEEMVCLKKLGVDAILVGEAFLSSSDIEGKVKELMEENGNGTAKK